MKDSMLLVYVILKMSNEVIGKDMFNLSINVEKSTMIYPLNIK